MHQTSAQLTENWTPTARGPCMHSGTTTPPAAPALLHAHWWWLCPCLQWLAAWTMQLLTLDSCLLYCRWAGFTGRGKRPHQPAAAGHCWHWLLAAPMPMWGCLFSPEEKLKAAVPGAGPTVACLSIPAAGAAKWHGAAVGLWERHAGGFQKQQPGCRAAGSGSSPVARAALF